MRDFKLYISAAAILLLGYLVAQYNKPSPVNWSITLNSIDKIPYGTYVLHSRLQDIFPAATVINTNLSAYNSFNDSTSIPGNYFIITKTISLSKNDFKQMVKHISAGNSVFISAIDWEGYLTDTLKLDTKAEFGKHTTALNFAGKQFKQIKNYQFDNFISNQYFSQLDTAKATLIGINEFGNANFISYRFGKGKLYLLANPQLLTNYNLLKPRGADYVAKALSYLPKNGNIYWDRYQNHDINQDESPLRVFFANNTLQWAYYLSFASLVLYVIYELKRRQRIIPVIEPLKNSTQNFVTVVGKVYYEQRDNANIAAKKILYLSDHLRNIFGLKLAEYGYEAVKVFAAKTGVDQNLAADLIGHINYIKAQPKITDHELIVLNQLIEKFYTQSGSYGK